MKRTFQLILLFWLIVSNNLYAQQSHPYLFYTNDRLELLKSRINTDESIKKAWKEIVQETDKALKESNPVMKLDYLSLVYLMTNDKKYAEKAKAVLQNVCSRNTWGETELLRRDPPWSAGLHMAHTNLSVAIAYDALYDYLIPSERQEIAERIMQLGIQPAMDDWLSDDKRIHTLNTMGHNWWTACVYMAGLSSLAIMNEVPQAAEWVEKISESAMEWFGFEGDVLHYKQKNFDKGGNYESINYAAYAFSEYLFFRLAWTNAFPERTVPEIKGLELIPDFFMHMSYPREGDTHYSLYFGDSSLGASGERAAKLLYGMGYENPDILWYLSQIREGQHKEGLPINTPLGIIYQPDMRNTPKLPDIPASAVYEDMGWASLRNSWERNATMLGIKCGFTWNHAHADASSFILMHKGEQIIKDAGNSWYGSPLYPSYFFQSPAHNVVLIDGNAQPIDQQYYGSPLKGSLHHLLDGGNIKYLLANATGPTSRYFSRNFRHFLWIDNVILIIDDVRGYDYSNFEWLLHPDGESKKVGGDIQIVNNNASVLVRPLWPETLIETGFDHDFPEKMKLKTIENPKPRQQEEMEIHYSIQYPEKVKSTKFITAILLKDDPDSKDLPKVTRLKGADMIGVRIEQNGKVTDVYLNLLADGRVMHLNSCNTFNGWDTDAYLMGISYPKGVDPTLPENISEYFIGYGSYIRKNETPIFNSLSKLFVVAKKENDNLHLFIDGQPVINAEFGFINRPAELKVNGESQMINYREGRLKIKR